MFKLKGLKRNLDHRVRRECEVHVVQLCSACGTNGQSDTQVVSSFAGSHLQGGRVKCRVKLFGNLNHGFGKAIDPGAHDLDGKVAGVLYERLFARVEVGGRSGRSAHKEIQGIVEWDFGETSAPNDHCAYGQPAQCEV